MDIEATVAQYLGGLIEDAEASVVVPEPRPERLVTVQRTGGGISNQLDHPSLAVQSWAPTLMEASALAREVDKLMRSAPYVLPDVFGVEATTVQEWQDPDSKTPRYQGLYTLTTSL